MPKRLLRNFMNQKPSKHDWKEDWKLENGQYIRKCFTCCVDFIGHKKRSYCKICYEKNKFTSDDVKNVRSQLALSQKSLSEVIGVNTMTVSRWERQELPIPSIHVMLMRALLKAHLTGKISIAETLMDMYHDRGFEYTAYHYVKKAYGKDTANLLTGNGDKFDGK